jgi:nitrate reductase beta subunit
MKTKIPRFEQGIIFFIQKAIRGLRQCIRTFEFHKI